MYKFFLGRNNGVQDEAEIRKWVYGPLFDLIALPAAGSKVHMLGIKIPVWIKWARRYYLDAAWLQRIALINDSSIRAGKDTFT